ncbi:MAG: fructose-1,6-bisphosphatase class 1 [Planctomycetota bacterium]|nr:MAG: fructose-1,6-bisphosphatase class 1 [Planctomycetota bacterium]
MRPIQTYKLMTLNRYVAEEQRWHPEATGTFTRMMWDISLATKMIAREVNKAGLADILGDAGIENVSGDRVQKLDAYAQARISRTLGRGGYLCLMASEEQPEPTPVPEGYPRGPYVLVFDPLDGSSNIDVNVSIGTIFGIYRRVSAGEGDGTLEDVLQPGSQLIAAGYVIYGSSTMLVYTSGNGVHGFTLDPSLGEYLLSHPDIRIPERGTTYSINEGYAGRWDEPTRRYLSWLKQEDAASGRPYKHRYVGTLVADVHRTLLTGGIFLYPSDARDPARPKPKLRLVYEANPMGFIIEQAGGRASTGRERILELQPAGLHQRVPLVLGSRREVELYEEFVAGAR